MARPFISIDMPKFRRSLEAAKQNIRATGERAVAALRQAMNDIGNDIIAEAQANAPWGDGQLRGSAVVEDTSIEGQLVSVTIGFNLVYARIRDQGGIIRPVRAKALFIPLRKGVRPKEPGLKLGVDFQLVPGPMTDKREVVQKGNGYFSRSVARRLPILTDLIGRRVIAILGASA